MSNKNEILADEKPKIKLNKKSRAAIISVSVIVVIGIIIAVCVANKTAVISNVTYLVMPKTIDTSEYDSSLDLVLYAEKNDEFDAKKDEAEPLKAFKYYYYDESGKKVSLQYDDSVLEGTDNEMMACSMFYYEVALRMQNLVKVLKIAAVILAVAIVIGAILIWFFSWSKRYDREKEAFNQQRHSGKNKKKSKK